MTATAPPPPATVLGEITPDRPLQEPSEVAGTAALAAIRTGLGAYLESVGYVAEHPLLYVNETEDPHVYVRFDVSADGLGFLDTTFVYSPGVSAQLDEIFAAYGVYETMPSYAPYTSEKTAHGRPVHAHIQALTTCAREAEIERVEDYARVVWRRPTRSIWRRCLIRFKAARRLRSKGRASPPAFGRRKGSGNLDVIGVFARALPVNWDATGPRASEMAACWRADADPVSAASASIETWRRFVEPRLPHVSRDRWRDHAYHSWLNPCGPEIAHGCLGDEWRMHDPVFWALKASFTLPFYWREEECAYQFPEMGGTLYDIYKSPCAGLTATVRDWLFSSAAQDLQQPVDMRALEEAARTNPLIHAQMFRLTRLIAVIAFRTNTQTEPGRQRGANYREHEPGSILDVIVANLINSLPTSAFLTHIKLAHDEEL